MKFFVATVALTALRGLYALTINTPCVAHDTNFNVSNTSLAQVSLNVVRIIPLKVCSSVEKICAEPQLLEWSNGTAPYYIAVIPGGDADGTAVSFCLVERFLRSELGRYRKVRIL